MPISDKKIRRKGVSILLISALMTTGLFSCHNSAYADSVVLSEESYYHLDMGVQIAYNPGCDWGSGNIYNSSSPISINTTITFNTDVEVLDSYPLNSSKGSSFDFNGETSSHNIPNELGEGTSAYYWFYKDYVSTTITEGSCSSSGKNVSFKYTARLSTTFPLEVVEYGKYGNHQEIYRLFGGKTALEKDQPEIADAIEIALDAGEKGTAGTNKLYLIFCPNVIVYKKYITVGDLEANLALPSSAKQGESYTAKDNSYIDSSLTVDSAVLEKHYGDGVWKTAARWNGTGAPGENTGGSVDESCDEIGTVTYRLTVTTTNDQVDTDIKTISITDSREISAVANLVLPSYTYEGHTVPAQDQSTFVVDGVNYSATRAYAEDIAKNSFKANSTYGTISRLTDTKADVTYSKRGTYNVTLTVDPISGSKVTDTKPIEVRKTPYIVDSLSGFQKQNRKQVLTATVATYPGKPLTDYSVALKDKKTGESVILTSDNPQQNTSTVKTRSVTMTQDLDEGFAYITVEFLTKTPNFFSTGTTTQDFYYEINVEDSKGDTDTASKTFPVKPDIPPTAMIGLDSAFLRNEGTNIASVRAEDVTVAADGDAVERIWYYGATASPTVFTNVASMDGYQKLSFGTDKIVGFHKVGVGRFTTKLFVKERWTEPTLEEYVTDSDHLTGTTTAPSDVLNVAPIVSLNLLKGIQKDVLLLANNDSEYQTLLNNKTSLQQTLLANKIDAKIAIKKLLGNTPDDVTGITSKLLYEFPTTIWKSAGNSGETDKNSMIIDSERVYFSTWTMVGTGSYTIPVTVHAYNPYSGEVWSYTTNRNEEFSFGNDDIGKYLYLLYPTSNQTVVLDKRTGTLAGTINTLLSDMVWITDNLFFIVENNNLYSINQATLTKTLIDTNVSAVSKVFGKLQYITKSETGIIKNTLNMETFTVSKELLVDVTNGVASSDIYTPLCIDSTGKVVLHKKTGVGTDIFSGIRAYSAENKLIKEISIAPSTYYSDLYYIKKISVPLDEAGKCNHVIIWEMYDDKSPYENVITGADLNTGKTGTYFTRSTGMVTLGAGAAFQTGNTSYMYLDGWFLNHSPDYYMNGSIFTFNGTTLARLSNNPGRVGNYDEASGASDRIIASFWGDNSTGKLQMKISALSKTLAQETTEIISRFSDKFTIIGNKNTTADQIKASVDTPKSMIMIKANDDGNLTLNNLHLTQDKKYNYEYEIKPLTETSKNRITGITATNGTITSSENFIADTLYVTESYKEDFNDNKINKFFTVIDTGWFIDGGYGSGYLNGNNEDSYSKISFHVPEGKQAIVSFDYDFDFNASKWTGTNIFVDGLKMDEVQKVSPTNGSESDYENKGHKIFYKILNSGLHIIETKVSAKSGSWTRVLLDNLKVDLLSATPKTISPTLNINNADSEGWLDVNGSFNTQKEVISYGAQQSSTYYGGMPAAITDYRGSYPETIEYYQTVPAGYFHKGRVHLGSNYASAKITYTIPGIGAIIREDTKVDEWTPIGIKSEGTYTYIVDMLRGDRYQAWMDVFDLVIYPNNAATVNGNIAFNDNNTKYFIPKITSTNTTNLSMFIPDGEYLIKNLRLYYIEDGRKIYLQNEDCEELADLSNWTLSSGLSASVVNPAEEKTDDEYVKIYKKGEKVIYDIFYDDYEDDPSKLGYWIYTHLNWPPDTVHPDVGKVLTAPIDRFYLSGKYTVTHWEVDNTQRTGTVGDAAPYNKESNKVTMTFYVDGEGKAPWITYIKTNPAAVKENNSYSINAGVDDTEKDTLRLETELYRNGSLLLSDTKTGIAADADGNYPEQTVNGLPTAQAGVYQIVCTVSDNTGTGIKSYKFTVVSEGKITGFVNHTDQWDENRKKYNLKRFSEEVNRPLQLSDYLALPTPRTRGTNVFWSGEKFLLRAETEGEPSGVRAEIFSLDPQGNLKSTGYDAALTDTGRKTAAGAELWEGSLWDADMINKWGRKNPEELTFRFTADYAGGVTKIHTVTVIMDSDQDYWQLHRLW